MSLNKTHFVVGQTQLYKSCEYQDGEHDQVAYTMHDLLYVLSEENFIYSPQTFRLRGKGIVGEEYNSIEQLFFFGWRNDQENLNPHIF